MGRFLGIGVVAVIGALAAVVPAALADPGPAGGERLFRLIEPAGQSEGRVVVPPDPASSPTPLIDPALVGRA